MIESFSHRACRDAEIPSIFPEKFVVLRKIILNNHLIMRFLLTLFLLISSTSFFAQTTETEKKLAEGIKLYNSLRDNISELTAETASTMDITFFYLSSSDIEPILDYVLQYGTDQEKLTARYFKANMDYELAFLLGMLGKNADCYPIMNSMKSDIEYFSNQSVFPLRYVYEGTNYVVNYTNFENSLIEYYTGFSEVCTNLGKTEEALTLAKKAISMRSATKWYNYIAYNKAVDAKKKLKQIDAEYIDYIVEWVSVYSQLDTAYLSAIKKNNYPSPKYITKQLTAAIDSLSALGKSGDQLNRFARTIKDNCINEAAEVYARTIQLPAVSLANIDEALAFFKQLYYSEASAFQKSNNGKTKAIVLEGCDKMNVLLYSNAPCYYWSNLSAYYLTVLATDKSQNAKKKAEDCQQTADKLVKRKNRRDNSEFGLCLSAYPVPMIWGNFGGSVELNFDKVSFALAGTKIGHDKDYHDDFYNPIQADKQYLDFYGNELDREELYYDGSRINASMKFTVSDESSTRGYFSLNVGRVMKTYDPFSTTIYDTLTAVPVYTGNILAKEKKYTFFLGFGVQSMLSERWMMDFGMGIGVSMQTLTVDSPYFSDRYHFDSYAIQSSQDNKIGLSGFLNASIGYYLFKP
jgi:hypothetical protein